MPEQLATCAAPLASTAHVDVDLLVVCDQAGICLDVSANSIELLGIAREEIVGRPLSGLGAHQDTATLRLVWERLVRDGQARLTILVHHRDGRPVWLDVVAQPLAEQEATAYLVVARDVTDDVRAFEHLAEAEQRWRLAFEHSPAGTALVGPDGEIRLANPTLATMLDYEPSALAMLSLDDITHVDDRAIDSPRLAALLSGRSSNYTVEKRFLTSGGRRVWGQMTAAAVPDIDGVVNGVIIQVQDVTQRRDAELELANRALHDPLSGLANRFLVQQWLSGALDEHLGGRVGVIYCDLDRFKLINDSLGHAAGDAVIVEAALRLRSAVRPEDLVGRVGGDEFVIVCERLNGPDDLSGLAERIVAAFDSPIVIDGHAHIVTMSMGAAEGTSTDTADELLRRADMALLRAKRLGRARSENFDAALDRISTREDLQLEDDLRASVDSDQLQVHYQPIVSLADSTIAGYESLLRWEHPERGLLPPAAFLDIAETSGLIRSLGWWVLAQSCRDKSRGRLPEGTWVAVNASPIQLTRTDLTRTMLDTIERFELRPGEVHLEITETTMMQASQSLVDELRALRAAGVEIALDDFGTGFSSLSLLRDFPVSMVKIDKSFVLPIMTDHGAHAIVRAVIGMCRDLGLPVVAEGVETAEQAERLTALGASHAQGFYFGRPAAAHGVPVARGVGAG